MNKKMMTEDDENYLHYLQSKYSRLNTDAAYAELNKFIKILENVGK